MKPDNIHSVTASSGIEGSHSFGLSKDNEASLMEILRDTLYTDKILAVLREYAANAWDAHRSVNKGDLPIKVTLPTWDSATLSIRDFGPGLSQDDVFNVYTQYGASTKRDSNDVVGMMGIGCKSAFAYTDMFTVISYYGAVKSTYVAVLDESNKGSMNLMATEPCAADDTGIEIQLAVKGSDIRTFEATAQKLFQHFVPRPEINCSLPEPIADLVALTHGSLAPAPEYGSKGWIAIMGCVPYRINLDMLDAGKSQACLPKLTGKLNFAIGDVQVNASREELKYSVKTKAALVQKFDDLVDEYVEQTLKLLDTDAISTWDKRLRLRAMVELVLPIPSDWEDFSQQYIKFGYDTLDWGVSRNGSPITNVTIVDSVRFLLDDTGKAMEGYDLGYHDYVVRGRGGFDLAQVGSVANTNVDKAAVRAAFDKVIEINGLTGVTISWLSDEAWTSKIKPRKGRSAPRHSPKVRVFTLLGDRIKGSKNKAPYSQYWAPETERQAMPDDVYVLVEGFRAIDGTSVYGSIDEEFFQHYNDDKQLLASFDLPMPAVYGYKTTEKKPADVSAIVGVNYMTWRKNLVATLTAMPVVLDAFEKHCWAQVFGTKQNYSYTRSDAATSTVPTKDEAQELRAALGADHPICEFINKVWQGKEHAGVRTLLGRGVAGFDIYSGVARTERAALEESYPLLKATRLSNTWHVDTYNGNASVTPWLNYVKLIDEMNMAKMMADAAVPVALSLVP